jgi:carbonic anhydrase
MSSSHKCEGLIISCIDFRFVTRIRDYLVENNLKDSYDLITVPGSSLNIKDVVGSITTSFKLHQPSKVYIFDHEDCGAYGNDNSEDRHRENLKIAKKTISGINSKIEVRTFMVAFKGVEEIK